VPYGGDGSFNPITVPTYTAATPPATTFPYNSKNYLQKVRLMLTTSSTFPRVFTVTPSEASIASGTINSFGFQVTGANLPCGSTPATCGTTVRFVQGSTTYTANCTGASNILDCTVDLTGATTGMAHMVVIAGGNTLTMPASPLLGGINVTP
jgi:hypothetical protein